MKTDDEFFVIIKEFDERPRQSYKMESTAVYQDQIKEYITKNHLTMKDFAKRCKISVAELSKIINADIHLETVFKIERVMGVEQGSLMKPDYYQAYLLLNL